jgi:hypothetical protein
MNMVLITLTVSDTDCTNDIYHKGSIDCACCVQTFLPLDTTVQTRRRLQQSASTDLSSKLSSLQSSLSSALNASAAASAMLTSSKTVNVGAGYVYSLVAMSDAAAAQAALIQAAINTAADGITRSLGPQQDREEDAYDARVCVSMLHSVV